MVITLPQTTFMVPIFCKANCRKCSKFSLLWPISTYFFLSGGKYLAEVNVKVSKSQKQFFLKLHFPKKERNIRQNSALQSKKLLNQKY